MPDTGYFHLHLVSDATGETLITVARAAAAQYANVSPVEHLYPMVRSKKQLDNALAEIAESPGLVLYTLLEEDLIESLEKNAATWRCLACRCSGRCSACSSPISAPRPSTASAPSTCSTRNISSASTRSTTPCFMTTASTSKGCRRPTWCWSASRARRKRRPRSISPIAASRPATCRWCRACRSRPRWRS